MRFDFFDLQLFLHIVSTGSFTKGAERSAISLQAASERIKKLEQYFDTRSFFATPLGSNLQRLDMLWLNMHSV
jgi:DNA-binding transcriptional LysR family regulator